MPHNQQFDSGELRSLAIGYDKLSSDLSPDVRLIGGLNMVVSNGGKLIKRPGLQQLGSFNVATLPGPIDHLIVYGTLDNPPKQWVVMSVKNVGTGKYEVWVLRLDGSGVPSSLGSLRNIDSSTQPHEFVVSRGLCFIKGYPAAGGDVLGTVTFNGSTGATTIWGMLGPTSAVAMTSAGGWTASTFAVVVNVGWYYVYTYKNINGHESNRSPLQTNPSLASSSTGVFSNKCPQFTIVGSPDSNISTIVIYRTTDGGGSFFRIGEITNVNGTITYNDRNFPDGNATPAQPVPDAYLDTTVIAPSLTSNSPPPSVAALFQGAATTLNGAIVTVGATSATFALSSGYGTFITPSLPFTVSIDSESMQVTAYNGGTGVATVVRGINGSVASVHGTGAPVRLTPIVGFDLPIASTPIATYAGRLWYAIGNILFYSGQEEISVGVPEEAWPSGLRGNFYRFNSPIVNVFATSEALYILCTEEVYWLRGASRDTFQLQKIFADIGAKRGHPRAVCAADKSIIWLTHDMRLCMARGYKREFISDKLYTDLSTAVNTNLGTIHLARYAEFEKDWIVVLSVTPTLSNCQQWVYDFNQGDEGIWNVPWGASVTAAVGGQPNDTSALVRKFIFAMSNGNTANALATLDMTLVNVQDWVPGTGATNYACNFTMSLVRNPTGNHVNALRLPGMVSVLHAIKLDRTAFTSDTDPALAYWLDTLPSLTYTASPAAETPPRRIQSSGYTTLYFYVDTACERVAVQVTKTALNERFEIQNLAYVWNPDSGA